MPPQRRCVSFRRLLVPVALTVSVISGCGAGEDLTAPLAGTLEIRTVTGGEQEDADGYLLALDDSRAAPIAADTAVLYPELSPGRHTATLTGLASNCQLEGGSPRPVTVVAGTTVSLAFSITCTAAPEVGALDLSVSTTGVDLDPDGYEVFVDPDVVQSIPATGTLRVEPVLAGVRVVRLGGVAANCASLRLVDTVLVPATGTAQSDFAVTCWPPLTGRIAFSREADVFAVSATGTGLRRIFDDFSLDDYPDWSPDGSRLVYTSERERGIAIYTVGADGSDTTAITADTFPATTQFPRWSPDAQRILFWAPDEFGEGGGPLYFIDANGSGLRRAPFNGVGWASWSPDGRRLAASISVFVPITDTCCLEWGLYLINPDGSDRKELVSPLDGNYRAVEWSPDGSRLALVDGSGLYVADTTATQIQRIFTPRTEFGEITGLDWSPDGSRLAVWENPFSSDDGDGKLYLLNADGTDLQLLLEESFPSGGVSWGP